MSQWNSLKSSNIQDLKLWKEIYNIFTEVSMKQELKYGYQK